MNTVTVGAYGDQVAVGAGLNVEDASSLTYDSEARDKVDLRTVIAEKQAAAGATPKKVSLHVGAKVAGRPPAPDQSRTDDKGGGPASSIPKGIKRRVTDAEAESAPRFVVTLDGVNASQFLKDKKFKRSVKAGPEHLETVDDEELLTEDELLLNDESNEYDDDDDDDDDVVNMLVDEDEFDMATEADDPLLDNKVLERCRYWPACKNGDQCAYHHPTVSCKTFPNCKFGDKCLYIHPNCKYDAGCTRRDCPFTHASKRSLVASSRTSAVLVPAPPVVSQAKKAVCKFYPKCLNPSCTFIHPKPCRYGQNCLTPSCRFSHVPFPSPQQLKWSAADHISERQFAISSAAQHIKVPVERGDSEAQ